MTLNLDDLRKIARSATPGEWAAEEEGNRKVIYALGTTAFSAPVMVSQHVQLQGDRDFMAAFSPKNVIELLDRCQDAEEALTKS